MRRIVTLVAVASTVIALLVVFGDRTVAAPKKPVNIAQKIGKPCSVVAQDNKGKSGTYGSYTTDDGNTILTCDVGGGSSTDCTNNDGTDNGACKAGIGPGKVTGDIHIPLQDILAGQLQILSQQETVLQQQQTVLQKLADLGIRIDDLQIKLDDVQTACLPPDLLPVPVNGGEPTPGNFCHMIEDILIVRVRNQGVTDAGPSTLRVTFATAAGPVASEVPTPAVPGSGGFVDLEVPVPPGCFIPQDPFPGACNFQIAVDVNDEVSVENSETNNFATGACVPVL